MFSPAPAARWHDVQARFEDFAITTFAVEPARLSSLLPDDCQPEISVCDGRERALVSAVSFRVRSFRLSALPWPAASFLQVNYRAYVRRGQEGGVWFFASAVAAPWHFVPRYVWRLPWRRARIAIDVTWDGDLCRRYALRQQAAWGDALLQATGGAPASLDADQARRLTEPLVGYCRRSDGRGAAYRVWHEPLRVTEAMAERARFQMFEDLRLVDADSRPHSVLIARQADFLVRLPPENLQAEVRVAG
jgi:uncharacterized protein YqjF (DUF2071 family)